MPGLNLLAATEPISPDVKSRLGRIQEKMLHFDSYSHETLLDGERAVIGTTAYESYPRKFVDTESVSIAIEGMIYNRTAQSITDSLTAIVDERSAIPEESLKKFVDQSDGDFIIVVHDKKNDRLFIINDTVGRLPFFYAHVDGAFVASREVKFILPFMETIEFKKGALLEYLVYGFPFGENTLIDGIAALRPSSLLVYDMGKNDLFSTTFSPPSLERKAWTGRKKTAAAFREKFIEGLGTRLGALGEHEPVVSLSGGLDSRALLAGMLDLGVSPRVLTMHGPEEPLARELAGLLDVAIETIPTAAHSSNELLERSIFLKDGLDTMATQGQLLFNVQHMAELCGPGAVYFTGMFGGELTRYLNPTSGIGSARALTEHVVDSEFAFKYSTEKACRMLGVKRAFALDQVGGHLDSYADENPYDRYIRFRLEFDRKWTGQGEDRNRFFFWTVTPFTSRPFYDCAMAVDENHKDTRLFRDFLHTLDPRTCKVKYYNLNLPLDSGLCLFAWSVAERATRYPFLKKMMYLANRFRKPVRQRKSTQSKHIDVIRSRIVARLGEESDLGKLFEVDTTRAIFSNESDEKGLVRMHILLTYMNMAREWCASLR